MSTEHDELLATLELHRNFLRQTVRGLSDEQAAQRSTASELCLGGIVKHVAGVESRWVDFIERGAEAMRFGGDQQSQERWAGGFRMSPGDTLEALLERYADVARRTEEVVRSNTDLDRAQELPPAPWFEPGATWSVRRVVLHLLAETAQHAGHADIVRESIDGAKTMG